MKGELVRCSVSRAILSSEEQQGLCSGNETAIGPTAYLRASQAVRDIFGVGRKRSNLDYSTCLDELAKKNDKTAKAARDFSNSPLKPATAAATSGLSFPSHRTGPTKPTGFA
jgi:hypothetical protein